MRSIHQSVIALALLSMTCAAYAPAWFAGSSTVLHQASTPLPQPTPVPRDSPHGRFSAISAPNMVLLSIEDDGRFRIFVDDVLLDLGKFNIAGSQVLVDSMECDQQTYRPALYNWLYDEDGLAFQPAVSDPCAERWQYLSEAYWPKYDFVFNIPDRGPSTGWLCCCTRQPATVRLG